MSNFKHIFNIPVDQILVELEQNPTLWNQHNFRTAFNKGIPFGDVSDIVLQYNDLNLEETDWLEAVPFPAMYLLPAARQVAHALMFATKSDRLGRVMITKLPPGGKITPHCDDKLLVNYYHRYHICLQDNESTVFRCGTDYYNPKVGEVFLFNNGAEHEVINNGETDRITMIVDLKKPVLKAFYENDDTGFPCISDPIVHIKKEYLPGINFQRENFSEIMAELKDGLIQAHWEENALNKDIIPLDPEWSRYLAAEKADSIHVFTIRDSGYLVGYHISFIGGHMHYKKTKHASVDIYYIRPEYRKTGMGLEFFKKIEESLKSIGVIKIITGTKVHTEHVKFFNLLGYQHADYGFIKIIE